MQNTNLQDKNNDFTEILSIIETAKEKAFKAVNYELISMYREIGKYISEKVKAQERGNAVVKEFSEFIQQTKNSQHCREKLAGHIIS